MCEQCTRRQFFERNALGGMVLAGAAVAYARAADTRPAAPRGKSRICVLFTGDVAAVESSLEGTVRTLATVLGFTPAPLTRT